MRKRIKSSVYDIDQPIPDEKTLAEEFGCSRMTMKRALDTLAAEGMLFRKEGTARLSFNQPCRMSTFT